jgi:hypothetical protein
MIDRVEKQRVMGVLRQTGLWAEADQYREQARQRLRDDGKGKQEAVEGAWDAMAEKFLPLAEQATPGFRLVLPDGAESLDDALDPEYAEADPVRRMRDAYVWLLAEFHRIVSDHDAGSVLDLRKAITPPPVGIALSIAQCWAAKPSQKRDGLFREIRVWLASAAVTSLADSEPETFLDEGKGSYLDQIT